MRKQKNIKPVNITRGVYFLTVCVLCVRAGWEISKLNFCYIFSGQQSAGEQQTRAKKKL